MAGCRGGFADGRPACRRVLMKLAGGLLALLLFALPAGTLAASAAPVAAPQCVAAQAELPRPARTALAWVDNALQEPVLGDEVALYALLRSGTVEPADPRVAAWLEAVRGSIAENAHLAWRPATRAWVALVLAAAGRQVDVVAPGLAQVLAQSAANGGDDAWAALLVFGDTGPLAAPQDVDILALAAEYAAGANPDGGFGANGVSAVQDTALAVQALACCAGQPQANAAVQAALAWLQGQMGPAGEFYYPDGTTGPALAAQVLLACAQAGVQPPGGENAGPMNALLLFRYDDGGFLRTPDGQPDLELTALCALALYADAGREAGAAVFDFDGATKQVWVVTQVEEPQPPPVQAAPWLTTPVVLAGLCALVALVALLAIVAHRRGRDVRRSSVGSGKRAKAAPPPAPAQPQPTGASAPTVYRAARGQAGDAAATATAVEDAFFQTMAPSPADGEQAAPAPEPAVMPVAKPAPGTLASLAPVGAAPAEPSRQPLPEPEPPAATIQKLWPETEAPAAPVQDLWPEAEAPAAAFSPGNVGTRPGGAAAEELPPSPAGGRTTQADSRLNPAANRTKPAKKGAKKAPPSGGAWRQGKPGRDGVLNFKNGSWRLQVGLLADDDPLWPAVAGFADGCSWRAGPALAAKMRQSGFVGWEKVLAATVNGELAGFCTLTRRDCLPDAPYTPYIGFVFVDESYRGARISGVLCGCAVEYARGLGFDQVYLVSGEAGLYEKYGFTPLEQRTVEGLGLQTVYIRKT